MSKFNIDFFELCMLAEACIPPRPIARTMFWQSLTDTYWEQMTEYERLRMFEWLQKNWTYAESLEKEEDTQVFHARFDPDNQYEVTTEFEGKTETHHAFLYNKMYYTNRTRYIAEEYIKQVSKFDLPNDQ